MRLYTHKDLKRIGLGLYAQNNLNKVRAGAWTKIKDDYYVPTDELEILVKEYNFMANLKGLKPARAKYRDTYYSDHHNCWAF
jgi:hypothetical protein